VGDFRQVATPSGWLISTLHPFYHDPAHARFKELTQYGFCRNLYGLRTLGIMICSIGAVTCAVVGFRFMQHGGAYQFTDLDATNFPLRFYQLRSP
jgi:hypothetical protein